MSKEKAKQITITLAERVLVNGLLEDIANVERKSVSETVTEIILKSQVPQNSDANFVVYNNLYSEDGGIGKTLAAVFNINAGGIEGKAKHDNLLPLVRFAQEGFCQSELSGNEKELGHAYRQVESIIEHYRVLSENTTECLKKFEYDSKAKLLGLLKGELHHGNLYNCYTALISNWGDLKNLTCTYRLLFDLVKLAKEWKETAESRIALLHILVEVSKEWPDAV